MAYTFYLKMYLFILLVIICVWKIFYNHQFSLWWVQGSSGKAVLHQPRQAHPAQPAHPALFCLSMEPCLGFVSGRTGGSVQTRTQKQTFMWCGCSADQDRAWSGEASCCTVQMCTRHCPELLQGPKQAEHFLSRGNGKDMCLPLCPFSRPKGGAAQAASSPSSTGWWNISPAASFTGCNWLEPPARGGGALGQPQATYFSSASLHKGTAWPTLYSTPQNTMLLQKGVSTVQLLHKRQELRRGLCYGWLRYFFKNKT